MNKQPQYKLEDRCEECRDLPDQLPDDCPHIDLADEPRWDIFSEGDHVCCGWEKEIMQNVCKALNEYDQNHKDG